MTRRARSGDAASSDRRHVGCTLPLPVKQDALEAARAFDWSLGDWVLTAAAENGPTLRAALTASPPAKRRRVPHATFTALYLTAEEVAELDDQAVACGCNRSAFVTAVLRLARGDDLASVLDELR